MITFFTIEGKMSTKLYGIRFPGNISLHIFSF